MNNDQYPRLKMLNDLSKEELGAFQDILELLYQKTGTDFPLYRDKCMPRRVMVKMHEHKFNKFSEYLNYLKVNPKEIARLLSVITINVSEFFRNPETFAAVKNKVLLELIKIKKTTNSRTIRIWSAGCATGEEPYSIAILLKEVLDASEKGYFTPIIYATDIDEEARVQAELGVYQLSALKELSPGQLDKCFTMVDDNFYQVNKEFRSMIKFSRHNMITDDPLRNIDLIFCRNVLIYFNKELQRKVYKNFYEALANERYIVAGKVETMIGVAEDLFDRVDLAERILKKKAKT